jgi:hypothetical protein
MTKQNELYRAIEENNIDFIKLLLLNENVNPSDDNYQALSRASELNHFHIVSLLLKDKRIKNINQPESLNWAVLNGSYESVKLLVEDGRIDVCNMKNTPIKRANRESFEPEYFKILKLLWSDSRIKKTLKKDDIALYNKLKLEDLHNNIRSF